MNHQNHKTRTESLDSIWFNISRNVSEPDYYMESVELTDAHFLRSIIVLQVNNLSVLVQYTGIWLSVRHRLKQFIFNILWFIADDAWKGGERDDVIEWLLKEKIRGKWFLTYF